MLTPKERKEAAFKLTEADLYQMSLSELQAVAQIIGVSGRGDRGKLSKSIKGMLRVSKKLEEIK